MPNRTQPGFWTAIAVLSVVGSFLLPAPLLGAGEKVFKNTRHGFQVTLPANWKKVKPDSSDTVFAAQRQGQDFAFWIVNLDQLKNTKEAKDFNRLLTKQTKEYAKTVLKELNKDSTSESCTTKSAKAGTVGSLKGAQLTFSCPGAPGEPTFTVSVFAFVRKTKHFDLVTIVPTSVLAKIRSEINAIQKSIEFTK